MIREERYHERRRGSTHTVTHTEYHASRARAYTDERNKKKTEYDYNEYNARVTAHNRRKNAMHASRKNKEI